MTGDAEEPDGMGPGRNRFAGHPISDDDATIAAALEDVSIPTLLMSMVHMTGDPRYLRWEHVPAGIYLNEVQGFMDPAAQQAVRDEALGVIATYRDGGCVLPDPPDEALLREMMQVLVASEVPEEYVPLILEELELDGVDARSVLDGSDPAEVPERGEWPDPVDAHDPAGDAGDDGDDGFSVVVIGAGMSGVLAGIRLADAGIPYTVIEKNPAVGGTWYENRYPGCRVDVGNHFYCYSFEPNDEWSEFFARQPELQAYFERAARDHDVLGRIRFDTEVRSARFDEPAGSWAVEVEGPEGVDTLVANAVISAVGQLNRPKLPDIDGIDDFAGVAMHSARWDPSVDLTGRRVAVVGTGASAFQIVPAIAERVGHLDVFQRSAPWMFPNPHYHDAVAPGALWAMRHLPFYARWYRFLIFWPACDGGLPAMRIDPEWPHQDRAVSELNDGAREFFSTWMVEQCGDDSELAAKVVPDYVCLGKRTLQDNGSWLAALTRPDVELVTDPIDRVTPTGIRCESGEEHPADVIVWATGFHANRYLWPMQIVGRGGAVLTEQWGDEPTAHLGITVPNFPNLFCMYGPGTNLASGGSLIFHSECQIRYIMGAIAAMRRSGHHTIEVRPEAHDAYNERLQAELATMVWSHPSIRNSWYRNDAGATFILSPWRLVDYWSWTREPELSDFVLR